MWAVASGQTLSPEVFASAGTSMIGANVGLDFTIGEVVTATLPSGSGSLTQGFQQRTILLIGVEEFIDVYTINLYPNPVQQFVTIETNSDEELQAKIYNAHGQLVIDNKVFTQKAMLNLDGIADGPYFLHITRLSGEAVKNFSIIKTATH
jgi:Secretion system C-terminal sorting domain